MIIFFLEINSVGEKHTGKLLSMFIFSTNQIDEQPTNLTQIL